MEIYNYYKFYRLEESSQMEKARVSGSVNTYTRIFGNMPSAICWENISSFSPIVQADHSLNNNKTQKTPVTRKNNLISNTKNEHKSED